MTQAPSWQALLASSGLPRHEARALLAAILGCRGEWLIAHGDEAATAAATSRFAAQAAARRDGVPLAYLTGVREFYGRSFMVGPAVLIPRHDTECLVETALGLLDRGGNPHLLDLGTGSGIVAITLALECRAAQVVATDRSNEALQIARRNADALGARNLRCYAGDWWQALADLAPGTVDRFDLIVSNPPYLAEDDPHLLLGDLRHEPRGALVAAANGLADIETLVDGARHWLRPDGWLLLEHGASQGAPTRERLRTAGFEDVRTVRDLEGRERVSLGRFPNRASNEA